LFGGFQTINPDEENLPEKQPQNLRKIVVVFQGGGWFLGWKTPHKESPPPKKPTGGGGIVPSAS